MIGGWESVVVINNFLCSFSLCNIKKGKGISLPFPLSS